MTTSPLANVFMMSLLVFFVVWNDYYVSDFEIQHNPKPKLRKRMSLNWLPTMFALSMLAVGVYAQGLDGESFQVFWKAIAMYFVTATSLTITSVVAEGLRKEYLRKTLRKKYKIELQ